MKRVTRYRIYCKVESLDDYLFCFTWVGNDFHSAWQRVLKDSAQFNIPARSVHSFRAVRVMPSKRNLWFDN